MSAPPALSAPAVQSGPLTAAGSAQAAALAASSGQPVEVLPDRTDWAQVFAEPAGGFLMQESPVPVRTQLADGSWVPVDATLSVQPDGLVAPAAITVGLSLSDGGTGPLYTLTSGGRSLSVSWPLGALPVPSLSGSTATYTGVLPGVNLLVTATPTGVRELLQVMSAQAAANPALAKITFPVAAAGLTASAGAQGAVTWSGASGTPVFAEPPVQMWDSAGQPASGSGPGAAVSAAGGPVAGDHVGMAAVSAGSSSLTLTPPTSLLTGAHTVYPLYIDPDPTSETQNSWSDVAHNFNGGTGAGPCSGSGGSWGCWGDWEYTDPAGGIRSGVYCATPYYGDPNCTDPSPDSTWGAYRSYFNFAVPSAIFGASYVDATLSLNEVDSWSCTASTVELWQTAHAGQGLTWANRPAEQTWQDSASVAKGYSSNCAPGGITLSASSALGRAAANDWSTVTLEVRAKLADENASPPAVNSWKRFQATGTGSDCASNGAPCLQVFWLHAPDQAQAIGTQDTFNAQTGQGGITDCSTHQASPDYVPVGNPGWQALANQPEGRDVDGYFTWKNLTTGASGTKLAALNNPYNSGARFTGQRTGGNGDEYQWQAYATTSTTITDPLNANQPVPAQYGTSSSPPCYFTIDTTAPTGVVSVTSDIYQNGVASGQVGKAGTFTFTDPDYSGADSDVVGYQWSLNSSQTTQYVPATSGTASITIKPYSTSAETLYVRAVDRAGNLGPWKTNSQGTVIPSFTIQAATTPANISTMAWWRLNANGSDVSGLGNNTALQPGASWPCASSASPPGYLCALSGQADTATGVVSPEAAFTVSAWVSTAGCSGTCVAMSEDGSAVSAFTLGYQASGTAGSSSPVTCPCWLFSMRAADSTTSNTYTAAAAATAAQQGGAWTQLDGVFDPDSLTVTLYVNGSIPSPPGAAEVYPGPGRWLPATPVLPGPLRLGAGYRGASPWAGRLSSSCVFYGVLPDTPLSGQHFSDIYTLDHGSGSTTDGCQALDGLYP
ncbi:MAG: hypothetical protein ACYCO9_19275 [Streptosporangiaceae bacterium]